MDIVICSLHYNILPTIRLKKIAIYRNISNRNQRILICTASPGSCQYTALLEPLDMSGKSPTHFPKSCRWSPHIYCVEKSAQVFPLWTIFRLLSVCFLIEQMLKSIKFHTMFSLLPNPNHFFIGRTSKSMKNSYRVFTALLILCSHISISTHQASSLEKHTANVGWSQRTHGHKDIF